MKKVESKVARKWYEYLAEGKMMALRCKDCGTYHFPAFPICHGCGKHDMEWVEISGDAVVTDLADVKFMSSGIDLNNLMSDAQKTTGVSKADSRPCSI
ncbi:MAG: hypothetical protein J6J03_02200 [Tyzzerella sp.]|nr:hypothetical protein [Lachnospiraceae bacterium]MBP3663952.1 hypothetical protein [Tyzzerella sp.]